MSAVKVTILCAVCIALGYGIGYYQYSNQLAKTAQVGLFDQFDQLNKQPSSSSEQQQRNKNNQQADGIKSTFDKLRGVEGISYTDFAQLALSPTADKVNEIIDQMSTSDLALAINSLTALDKDEIEGIDDAHAFSKNLVKAVLRNTRLKTADDTVTIIFGTEADNDNEVLDPVNQFSVDTDRIYASFILKNKQYEKVMIKWFLNAPYTLQILNRYRINSDTESNYVWFRSNQWKQGVYTVEVFAMDSDLTLLASGNFEVIN